MSQIIIPAGQKTWSQTEPVQPQSHLPRKTSHKNVKLYSYSLLFTALGMPQLDLLFGGVLLFSILLAMLGDKNETYEEAFVRRLKEDVETKIREEMETRYY